MDYLIDYSGWTDEGGTCQVYPILNQPGWIFKEFRNKKKAAEAYNNQKKLAKFDLAPQIYSPICKLYFANDGECTFPDPSDWGYITECAKVYGENTRVKMKDIQSLVEDIKDKTGLKFWDCHWYNVGIVKRQSKSKLVCIDTGKESFISSSNAWGLADPGPKCYDCNKYQCTCSEY